MIREVVWSRAALDDVKAQITHIATGNPAAAARVATTLRTTATALSQYATGRPGRVVGTYEKSVQGLPYVIAYMIAPAPSGETIAILRVIHTSRDWPKDAWP